MEEGKKGPEGLSPWCGLWKWVSSPKMICTSWRLFPETWAPGWESCAWTSEIKG